MDLKDVQLAAKEYENYKELYERILSGKHQFRIAFIRDLDEEERIEEATKAEEAFRQAQGLGGIFGIKGQMEPPKPKKEKFYNSVPISEVMVQRIIEYLLPEILSNYQTKLAILQNEIGEMSLERENKRSD